LPLFFETIRMLVIWPTSNKSDNWAEIANKSFDKEKQFSVPKIKRFHEKEVQKGHKIDSNRKRELNTTTILLNSKLSWQTVTEKSRRRDSTENLPYNKQK